MAPKKPSNGDPLGKLPFEERWNRLGNATTEAQIHAARKALQTPSSRACSRGALVPQSGKENFSRTATSLKLQDELRQTHPDGLPGMRFRRASTIEAGSPLRRLSLHKSLSKEVQTELPRWRSVAAGSGVQILDRPDFLGRVERGLELSRSKRGSFQAIQANTTSNSVPMRSRKDTDASAREEDQNEDQERQRRLRQIEQVRLRDTKNGMFDAVQLPELSASLPNLLQKDETWKSLDEFNKKVVARARKSYIQSNPMGRMSKAKILSLEEEEKVDHFWDWCRETFGTLVKAFQAFDLNGNGLLSSVEFAEGCRAHGYPGNAKVYKQIFFLMDADLDGVIGKKEFGGSKVIRRSALNAEEERKNQMQQRSSVSFDAFDNMDSKPRQSVLESKRKTMVNELYKQDPPISQFIEFLFSAYASLKDAFRQIDINRNGLLSKSEFKDGLRILRVGNMNLFDMHLHNLFDRIDIDQSGHITVDEMTSDSADPMIQRLVKYLLDVRSDFHAKHERDAHLSRQTRLHRVFAKLDDDSNAQVDRQEFVSALKRLRYLDWHASDLFDRLDRDRSGQLSVQEFTAFLEKDKEEKVESKRSAPDPDGIRQLQMEDPSKVATEIFQEKFATGAFSVIFSTKLQKIGTRSGHTADLLRDQGADFQETIPGTGAMPGLPGGFVTDDTGGFAQRYQRSMDYCEEIRSSLKRPDGSQRKSCLSIDGHHTYGVSPMRNTDYLPLCMGLKHLIKREDFARSTVTF